MLGLYPVGSRAISAGPFSLVTVSLAMSAVGSITFGGVANAGAFTPMSASGQITLSGSPRLFVNQALSAAGLITFGGTPRLFIAGKPIILTALPQSFTLRADRQSYTATALPQGFTIRGVR